MRIFSSLIAVSRSVCRIFTEGERGVALSLKEEVGCGALWYGCLGLFC